MSQVNFSGEFTLDHSSSDSVDGFLRAKGVGMIMRKTASSLTPVTVISQDGVRFNIKTITSLKTKESNFVADGEEYAFVDEDGNNATYKATLVDGVFIVQVSFPGTTLKSIRTLENEGSTLRTVVEYDIKGTKGTMSRVFKK